MLKIGGIIDVSPAIHVDSTWECICIHYDFSHAADAAQLAIKYREQKANGMCVNINLEHQGRDS